MIIKSQSPRQRPSTMIMGPNNDDDHEPNEPLMSVNSFLNQSDSNNSTTEHNSSSVAQSNFLFDLITKSASRRLDDQRAEMPPWTPIPRNKFPGTTNSHSHRDESATASTSHSQFYNTFSHSDDNGVMPQTLEGNARRDSLIYTNQPESWKILDIYEDGSEEEDSSSSDEEFESIQLESKHHIIVSSPVISPSHSPFAKSLSPISSLLPSEFYKAHFIGKEHLSAFYNGESQSSNINGSSSTSSDNYSSLLPENSLESRVPSMVILSICLSTKPSLCSSATTEQPINQTSSPPPSLRYILRTPETGVLHGELPWENDESTLEHPEKISTEEFQYQQQANNGHDESINPSLQNQECQKLPWIWRILKKILNQHNHYQNLGSYFSSNLLPLFTPLITSPQIHSILIHHDTTTPPPTPPHYKFGVLLQLPGQSSEEQLFSNTTTHNFDKFLSFLGTRVKLQGFDGYRAGLDTLHNQTGNESIYTKHGHKEVMFHVSTMLPKIEGSGDEAREQVGRKRFIGNDIVSIIYQDGPNCAKFNPELITSHFLHAYIVVRGIEKRGLMRYYVSITTRATVPITRVSNTTIPKYFTRNQSQEFSDFLLSTLIHLENSCYEAKKFKEMNTRTRKALLTNCIDDLKKIEHEIIGGEIKVGPIGFTPNNNCTLSLAPPSIGSGNQHQTTSSAGLKFIETVKKAMKMNSSSSSQSKSLKKQTSLQSQQISTQTSPTISCNNVPMIPSTPTLTQKSKSVEISSGSSSSSSSDNDSIISNNSSSSSIEHNNNNFTGEQKDDLINKLKLDKLDLLRQNVSCQRDIKKLKERELQLSCDLNAASREIQRLKNLLKENERLNSSSGSGCSSSTTSSLI